MPACPAMKRVRVGAEAAVARRQAKAEIVRVVAAVRARVPVVPVAEAKLAKAKADAAGRAGRRRARVRAGQAPEVKPVAVAAVAGRAQGTGLVSPKRGSARAAPGGVAKVAVAA